MKKARLYGFYVIFAFLSSVLVLESFLPSNNIFSIELCEEGENNEEGESDLELKRFRTKSKFAFNLLFPNFEFTVVSYVFNIYESAIRLISTSHQRVCQDNPLYLLFSSLIFYD